MSDEVYFHRVDEHYKYIDDFYDKVMKMEIIEKVDIKIVDYGIELEIDLNISKLDNKVDLEEVFLFIEKYSEYRDIKDRPVNIFFSRDTSTHVLEILYDLTLFHGVDNFIELIAKYLLRVNYKWGKYLYEELFKVIEGYEDELTEEIYNNLTHGEIPKGLYNEMYDRDLLRYKELNGEDYILWIYSDIDNPEMYKKGVYVYWKIGNDERIIQKLVTYNKQLALLLINSGEMNYNLYKTYCKIAGVNTKSEDRYSKEQEDILPF